MRHGTAVSRGRSNRQTFSYRSTANNMSETATLKKAPITISDRAASEIRKIMTTKEIPEGFGLRVGVRGGGCSGMSYVLGFDRMRDYDVTYEIDGIRTYIDKRQGLYLMGTTVDYHDGLNARGFTFENPNAAETCGCGSSFSA
jgi:iron-sulfur cluster assembly protein